MSTALHAALLTPSGQHAIITPPADGSDRPLVRAASILAALTAVAMTAYLLVIAAHEVPYVVRARLATLAAVLVVLTGATLITLAALRVQRRQRADDLAALREHQDRQAAGCRVVVEQGVARLEAVVGQRVDGLEWRLEAAERRVDGTDRDDILRGMAGWAKQIDQRLAQLQSGVVVLTGPASEEEGQRVNGSHPSGIDAEAISMAREFSERIRRLEHDS